MKSRSPKTGRGCLTLFALPFAGVGLFMAYLVLSALWSFAAAHKLKAALSVTLFLAICSGFVALLLTLKAPLFFTAIFGLVDVLILLGVINLWCGATRIEVGYGELDRRGGLFALGCRQRWRADEIERFEPARGMQAGRKLFYNLKLVPRQERTRTLAARLDSRAQAEALARRLETALRGH